MEAYLLTSGSAGVALLVNSMFWKLHMIAAWRSKLSGKSDAEASVIRASPKYITDHSAQLNEAEWSAPLLAATLFLAAKGVPAPIASTLAVVGSIVYPVSRIHLGGKITPIGAVLRLAGMGALTYTVFKTLKK